MRSADFSSPLRGLCRKSIHGSTGSPRTDHRTLKINELAVRPELVEGETANYDTVSWRENSLEEVLLQLVFDGVPASPKKILFRGEGTGGIASYAAGWMAGKGMDVIVLDGANRFNPYIASSFARKALISPQKILKRIRIARAFTCYQMATLMGEQLPTLLKEERATVPTKKPWVILLGPITTFLDEDVSERKARPLFERALSKIEEMAAAGVPFFLFQTSISNPPRPPFAKGGFSKRAHLMKRLAQFSNWVWRIELGDKEPKIILERGIEVKNIIENCKLQNEK